MPRKRMGEFPTAHRPEGPRGPGNEALYFRQADAAALARLKSELTLGVASGNVSSEVSKAIPSVLDRE